MLEKKFSPLRIISVEIRYSADKLQQYYWQFVRINDNKSGTVRVICVIYWDTGRVLIITVSRHRSAAALWVYLISYLYPWNEAVTQRGH